MKLKALTLSLLLPICAVAQNKIGTTLTQFMNSKDIRQCITTEMHENNQKKKLSAYMDVVDYRFSKSQSKKAVKLIETIRSHRFEAYNYQELLPGSDERQKLKIWIDRGTETSKDEDMLEVKPDNESYYTVAYVRSQEDEKYRHAYIVRWEKNATKDNYMTMRIVSIFGRDPHKLVRTASDFVAEFGKLLSVLSEAEGQRNPTSFARSALNRIYEFCETYQNTMRSLSRQERATCCDGIKQARRTINAITSDTYNSQLVDAIDSYIWMGNKK